MKKLLFIFFVLGAVLLLSGCVSGERLARNTPFASGNNSFYRDGVNLFPLYYQEGVNRSILFPLIDIDDRGFAVRPFYHKDKDEHGILWPLAAFNKTEGWVGPYYWKGKENFGLLPFFIHDDEFVWVFPASWYSKKYNSYAVLPLFAKNKYFLWVFPASWYSNKNDFGVLPLFCKSGDLLWIGNVLKTEDMFLIFPIYGQGKDWIYFLNFVYSLSDSKDVKSFCLIPLAYYENKKCEKGFCEDTLYSPLVSFKRSHDKLNMLNIGMLLYHYSGGDHHFFYPLADMKFADDSQWAWIWPLFHCSINGKSHVPLFLFDYTSNSFLRRFSLLGELLLEFRSYKDTPRHSLQILPFGVLWKSELYEGKYDCRVLATLLWHSEHSPEMYDYEVLCGLLFRNRKDAGSRRFSLLYKFFSYHRFKDDVKWEFFPFVKIMETAKGDSWSFCWRLLEKHDGGGHIFFIPWGKSEDEK